MASFPANAYVALFDSSYNFLGVAMPFFSSNAGVTQYNTSTLRFQFYPAASATYTDFSALAPTYCALGFSVEMTSADSLTAFSPTSSSGTFTASGTAISDLFFRYNVNTTSQSIYKTFRLTTSAVHWTTASVDISNGAGFELPSGNFNLYTDIVAIPSYLSYTSTTQIYIDVRLPGLLSDLTPSTSIDLKSIERVNGNNLILHYTDEYTQDINQYFSKSGSLWLPMA